MSTHTGSDPVWVRYNPRSAMLLLMGLSPEAELAHRRLCDYIWGGGPWPSLDYCKAGELGRVPRKRWRSVLCELESMGWRTRNRRLFNPTVAALREDAVAAYACRQAKSKAGNMARWSPTGIPTGTPTGTPAGTPPANPDKISEDSSGIIMGRD